MCWPLHYPCTLLSGWLNAGFLCCLRLIWNSNIASLLSLNNIDFHLLSRGTRDIFRTGLCFYMYASGGFLDCNQMRQATVSFVWLEGSGSPHQIPAKRDKKVRLSCCCNKKIKLFLCDCFLYGKPKTKKSKQWTRINFAQHKFSPETATAEMFDTNLSIFLVVFTVWTSASQSVCLQGSEVHTAAASEVH